MAYPLRWPGGPGRCAVEAFDVITRLIHAQAGEDNVAAVIIEPVQGEGGFVVPPDGFLPRLAEYCAGHGILLIADEVQSGFCRTGDWCACDHEGVVPHLPRHHWRGRPGLPPGRRGGAHLRHLRQRASFPAAASHRVALAAVVDSGPV